MGGIHPRPKQTVGRRLALAARAIAYGDDTVVYTGPVMKNCSLGGEDIECIGGRAEDGGKCGRANTRFPGFRQITVNFREDLMKTDALKLWWSKGTLQELAIITMFNCLNTSCIGSSGGNETAARGCFILNTPVCSQGLAVAQIGPYGNGYNFNANNRLAALNKPISPLEVQYNHTVWMPASINYAFGHQGGSPFNLNCKASGTPPHVTPACANYSHPPGWSSMTANVPVRLPLGCQQQCNPRLPAGACTNCTDYLTVTGVRYAWSESPCCGGAADLGVVPCPVNSCPVSLYNASLPAVPFTAQIAMNNETSTGVGACKCEAPNQCS